MIFGRWFKEGSCPLMRLIISFFHSSLVQLVVEVDDYFDKVEHVVDEFAITHNLVLEVVLEASSKHYHKCDIVSFDKVGILLKPCCLLCCKGSLS